MVSLQSYCHPRVCWSSVSTSQSYCRPTPPVSTQCWSSVSSLPATAQCGVVSPVCPLLLPQPSVVLVQCVLSSCLNYGVGPVFPLLLPQPSAVLAGFHPRGREGERYYCGGPDPSLIFTNTVQSACSYE